MSTTFSSVAERLPSPPVIIGHSMGGLIVQKYLERARRAGRGFDDVHSAAGKPRKRAALDQATPIDFAKMTITGKALPYINPPQLARERFFSSHTPEADVRKYAARLQEDSSRIGIDCLLLRLPRPKRVTAPLLVLGAEEDAAHTRKEILATARAYGTQAEFFPDMGHNMMLEPGWAAVAERIDTWLGTRGL